MYGYERLGRLVEGLWNSIVHTIVTEGSFVDFVHHFGQFLSTLPQP
jgi:hypothetical protein